MNYKSKPKQRKEETNKGMSEFTSIENGVHAVNFKANRTQYLYILFGKVNK